MYQDRIQVCPGVENLCFSLDQHNLTGSMEVY